MDPLSLLPVEVWRVIFKMLPLDDRVTAGQVSRSWRQFFRDPMMWIGVILEVGEDPKHIKPSFAYDDDSDDSSEWEDVEDEDSSGSSDDDSSDSMDERYADFTGDGESVSDESEDGESEADSSADDESGAGNCGEDKSETVSSGNDESEAGNREDDQSTADNCGDGKSEGNDTTDDERDADNMKDDHQGCDNVQDNHADGDDTARNGCGNDYNHGTSGISEDKHTGSNTANSVSQCIDDSKDATGVKEDPEVQESISPDSANGEKSSRAKTSPSDESAHSGNNDSIGVAGDGQQSGVDTAGRCPSGYEAGEKPACQPGRARDHTSCRVLRAAPCLRAIVVRGWHVSAPIMKALMETTSEVTCLIFTTFIAEPKDAEKIVSKLSLHLEELHFREASPQLLELLSVLRVPRLRNFAVDTVAECPLGSDLYFGKSWIDRPSASPTPAPLALAKIGVAFIKAHSSTLRHLTIGNMWGWVPLTAEVMEAVSSCRGLTHLGVICSEFLRIGAVTLPALKHLSIKLMLHNDDEVDHRLCLEPLPPSLEDLDLSLILVDLPEVLDVLVPQAPSLPNLRKLHFQFIFKTADTVKQLQRLRAAFPDVTVSSEARIDFFAKKENRCVFQTVPGSYIPPPIDWSKCM